ncbi:hypothetical protein D9757_008360 [Collybiopsis confluens]|uniref:Pheromone n=1 Tax=Collybiopsis confluens TaxID=2823264 RepID=A0A8H5HEG1_9AGAR|nr:hypothetical protein D9757_008360 [Collybiopsis confluens]
MDTFTTIDPLHLTSTPSDVGCITETLSLSPSPYDDKELSSILPVNAEAGGGDLIAFCIIS